MKSKRARVAPAAAVVGIAATLVLPGTAGAASSYSHQGSFSGQGSSDGLLTRPKHIAVEARTGYIFVTDSGNNRIEIFRPAAAGATYLTEIAGGLLSAPVGIAIDQATGDLYVSDSGNNRIVRLVSDGAATPTYTLDPTFTSPAAGSGAGQIGDFAADVELAPDGDLLVADPGDDKVQRYDSTGAFVREFDGTGSPSAFTGLRDIAVDGDGDILVVDDDGGDIFNGGSSRVERFDADGAYIGSAGAVPTPDSVTVDPRTDDVIVGGNIYDSYWNGNPLKFYVFDDAGNSLFSLDLPASTVFSALPSVAVDGGNDARLYVLTDRDPSGDYGEVAVNVYEPPPPPVPPSASTLGAVPTETTARLYGRVDPNRVATRYWFEWGVTDSYGASAPATRDGDAGSGDDPLEVSRNLINLAPGVYHFRVVAENSAGTTYGRDRTFTVTGDVAPPPTAGMPDGRGLEVVSPGRGKGTGELSQLFVQISPDGSRALYQANNPFGDASHGLGGIGNGLAYLATRTDGGWSSRFVTNAPQPSTALNGSSFNPVHRGASTDLSQVFFDLDYYRTPGFTSGVWANDANGGASVVAATPAGASSAPRMLLSSYDGSHRVISSSEPLGTIPGGTVPTGATLWEQTPDGQLRLVNADDSGELLHATPASVASGGGAPGGDFHFQSTQKNAISHDGSRVFFLSRAPGSSNGSPQRLYVRIGGEHTVEVSASQQSSPAAPTAEVLFAGASADGTKAFFATTDELTDDATGAGPFLYEFDIADGATTGSLKLVAGVDHEIVTTIFNQGVDLPIAQTLVADDGSRIYYLSSDDDGSLYVYETATGETRLVAAHVGAVPLAPKSDAGATQIAAETTPTGSFLLFSSDREGVAGADDTNNGDKLYRYDAASGAVTLVSSTPTAPPTRYDVELRSSNFTNMNLPMDGNAISDDGQYVFFETTAALVPGDENNKLDVYRWRAGDGVSIVTDGVSKSDSLLAGASADGSSVFFITLNDLVPQDGDGFFDLYVARVGGGFPVPESSQACTGDTCQGMPTVQPPDPKSLTDSFSGTGNAPDEPSAPSTKPSLRLTKPNAKQKAAFARTGRVTIRVKSATAGTVTGRLRVKNGKRWVLAGTARKAAKAGATVRITLRLSSAMRARLARTGALRVRVEVSHSRGGATKSTGFVARAARPAKRASSASNGGLW